MITRSTFSHFFFLFRSHAPVRLDNQLQQWYLKFKRRKGGKGGGGRIKEACLDIYQLARPIDKHTRKRQKKKLLEISFCGRDVGFFLLLFLLFGMRWMDRRLKFTQTRNRSKNAKVDSEEEEPMTGFQFLNLLHVKKTERKLKK